MTKIYIVHYTDGSKRENVKAFSNKLEQEKFYKKALKSDVTNKFKYLVGKTHSTLPISKKGLMLALTKIYTQIK